MAEEKKEAWVSYLALTTVIFAVCATLSTFKGGGFSTRSVMSQAQASDKWAFFQAKSTKENLYRLQKENLELEVSVLSKSTEEEILARYKVAIKKCEENIAKYEEEKSKIHVEAKALEEQRDDAQRHGKPFGLAIIFLQVAILLSSISGLIKRKTLWYLAIPVGLVGILFFANGFFLFL